MVSRASFLVCERPNDSAGCQTFDYFSVFIDICWVIVVDEFMAHRLTEDKEDQDRQRRADAGDLPIPRRRFPHRVIRKRQRLGLDSPRSRNRFRRSRSRIAAVVCRDRFRYSPLYRSSAHRFCITAVPWGMGNPPSMGIFIRMARLVEFDFAAQRVGKYGVGLGFGQVQCILGGLDGIGKITHPGIGNG